MATTPHNPIKLVTALLACFLVPGFGTVSHAVVPVGLTLTGGGLTLLEEGPVAAAAGDPAPANLATGATPFADSELSGFSHFTVEANDGFYGNASSWISGGTGGPDGFFIGIDLGAAPIDVNRIAFGRSNVLLGDVCGGVCVDRNLGLYTLQFTQFPNPDETLVTTGDPATGWADIGTLDYVSGGVTPNFDFPHQRHLYEFDAVSATGLRLVVPFGGLVLGTAIDDIELYHVSSAAVVPALSEWGVIVLISLLAGAAVWRVRKRMPSPQLDGPAGQ